MEQCYNRGCGQKYDPNDNPEDACRHHPGEPFFHDAYKGWSCCNKKCIDFTEFLNIKGCTFSKHSNIKPPEPIKETLSETAEKEVIEIKPMVHTKLERPPVGTFMTTIKPEIAPSLKQQLLTNAMQTTNINTEVNLENIPIGTSCKNKGCSVSYEKPQSNEMTCLYHSGLPIFHEGLKYWSCCQKRTTDFDVFLNQAGCQVGKHTWIKGEEDNDHIVNCRWDWHQTGSYVVVSIYAKNYCTNSSIIQINPIRLFTNLVFPAQSDATFTLDIELEKIIDVKASQATMYSTKIEIKLKKAEPYTWKDLQIKKLQEDSHQKVENKVTEKLHDPVDLSDF